MGEIGLRVRIGREPGFRVPIPKFVLSNFG
jgi:hypothetical protein